MSDSIRCHIAKGRVSRLVNGGIEVAFLQVLERKQCSSKKNSATKFEAQPFLYIARSVLDCLSRPMTDAWPSSSMSETSLENQVLLPISYRGHLIEDAYRADFIIDKRVVIEVKAVSKVLPVHLSQIHTYVRLTGCRLGLLMNFHSPKLVDGITRVVY